ncbi:MAG: ArsR family transcriptional regulator [Ruminococcus sp.]|nr:ArsR family transcriptional regulator [Ruminococcus sp.]
MKSLASAGYIVSEIADVLGVSTSTIRYHLKKEKE